MGRSTISTTVSDRYGAFVDQMRVRHTTLGKYLELLFEREMKIENKNSPDALYEKLNKLVENRELISVEIKEVEEKILSIKNEEIEKLKEKDQERIKEIKERDKSIKEHEKIIIKKYPNLKNIDVVIKEFDAKTETPQWLLEKVEYLRKNNNDRTICGHDLHIFLNSLKK